MYSTLRLVLACPSCHGVGPAEIQFRYGDTWMREYALGSALVWGRADVGDPHAARVAVDGWLACTTCGFEGRHAVFVRDGILWGVGPVKWVPTLPDQGWVALEL